MRIAVYIGKRELVSDKRFVSLLDVLRDRGYEVHVSGPEESPSADADMLLSVGGDGTFLSSSVLAAERGLPVMGVNLGRLGFLSENRPEDVAQALLSGDYSIENRTMLKAESNAACPVVDDWPYALN